MCLQLTAALLRWLQCHSAGLWANWRRQDIHSHGDHATGRSSQRSATWRPENIPQVDQLAGEGAEQGGLAGSKKYGTMEPVVYDTSRTRMAAVNTGVGCEGPLQDGPGARAGGRVLPGQHAVRGAVQRGAAGPAHASGTLPRVARLRPTRNGALPGSLYVLWAVSVGMLVCVISCVRGDHSGHPLRASAVDSHPVVDLTHSRTQGIPH